MRIAFFFAFLCILALVSCEQEKGRLVTKHGYEYVNHTNLDGAKPQPGEYVYFQVQIRNGDSITHSTRLQGAAPFLQIPSVDNPQRRPSPLEDVLREMSVGDSVTVFIRLDSLRGKFNEFNDAEIIYYDVVLNDIKTVDSFQENAKREREEQKQEAEAARARFSTVADEVKETLRAYKAGELQEQLHETDSGLKYIIHEQGSGKQVEPGRNVSVHYFGALMNGKMYDSSFKQGDPLRFPVGEGRRIKGWDEAVTLLREGEKATFFIPWPLAYGEKGSSPDIPSKADLVLYLEVVEVY
ncbi:MAG: FKBP-type peptidyl-prolyl cis-trans isomerase [Phaeodactylibacter sp.]|nr:FKBP-type peptidyl-prolyl cis-trans isomerase [Phaeodactylibacter sp.]MCB9050395.1 FKBP-type peptidyl-prolyl cis-trans isomerase [Lewinellaceae bacterium]